MTFTKLVFDLQNCKVITFEKKKKQIKNHRKIDTPNATSHIYIFDSNLL